MMTLKPAPDLPEMVTEMYSEVISVMPAGAMNWLKAHRKDIIAVISAAETTMDNLVSNGRHDAPESIDRVKRMYLRSWRVYQEASNPAPHYQAYLFEVTHVQR